MKLEIEFENTADLMAKLTDLMQLHRITAPAEPDQSVQVSVPEEKVEEAPEEKAEEKAAPKRRGRPKGSKNKPKEEAPKVDEVEEGAVVDTPKTDLEKVKKEALDVLMTSYQLDDKKDAVMEILKGYKVKKFSEIPVEHAEALMAQAKEVAAA